MLSQSALNINRLLYDILPRLAFRMAFLCLFETVWPHGMGRGIYRFFFLRGRGFGGGFCGRGLCGPGSDDRFGFDFDEHVGVDQAANLDHDCGGANVAKHFAVRAADLLPIGDAGDVHARAHYVVQRSAGALQGAGDVFENLPRLPPGIAFADDFTLGIGGRSARDVHDITDADGAGVADDGFPGSAGWRC
jgi:hypothetical protein